jgi:thiamine biosynthesis lipoprotein
MAEDGGALLRALTPFGAMTTRVECLVPRDAPAGRARRRLRRVFGGMERRLTRFRPGSELNRLCRAGGGIPSAPLFRAIHTAARAWRRTAGLFDPRVRASLEALGYTADLRFGADGPPAGAPRGRWPRRRAAQPGPWLRVRWQPRGLPRHAMLLPAGQALDLGGIGKGLAVRYAARALRVAFRAGHARPATLGPCGLGTLEPPGFLLNAGGDIWAEGPGLGGQGWTVGVPGPDGRGGPLAVLRVANRAVCTSSRMRRAWESGGRAAHHLIDPRTGWPADPGLASVTVVGRDPAWAEVWSKTLFVAGAECGPTLAEGRGLSAVFVRGDGTVRVSGPAERYLVDRSGP